MTCARQDSRICGVRLISHWIKPGYVQRLSSHDHARTGGRRAASDYKCSNEFVLVNNYQEAEKCLVPVCWSFDLGSCSTRINYNCKILHKYSHNTNSFYYLLVKWDYNKSSKENKYHSMRFSNWSHRPYINWTVNRNINEYFGSRRQTTQRSK